MKNGRIVPAARLGVFWHSFVEPSGEVCSNRSGTNGDHEYTARCDVGMTEMRRHTSAIKYKSINYFSSTILTA